MNKTVVFFESKCQRIKQIAVAKPESGPLLDFVQLKVLYWNLYGLGMAEIEVSDAGNTWQVSPVFQNRPNVHTCPKMCLAPP